jgi:hypothetical protein
MDRSLNWYRLFASHYPRRGALRPRSRRRFVVGPAESLEVRKLLAVTEVSAFASTLTPKDQTNVPGEIAPSTLYLNFDGGSVPVDPVNRPTDTLPEVVRPFDTEAQDNQSQRDALIQEILYEVAEIYAPFDVQVVRAYGAGTYSHGGGDTTIFIGGDDSNMLITPIAGGFNYQKSAYSHTPPASGDNFAPGHQIDTDAFHIAFVDPVQGSTQVPGQISQFEFTGTAPGVVNATAIAQAIAHEAGHTFGLVHVRSDGLSDPVIPSGGGTVNDIMAYDASNVYFANQNLTITTYNNNGSSSAFNGPTQSYVLPGARTVTTFQTQNSYQTLQDVLGARPVESQGTVAETGAVDPACFTSAESGAGVGSLPATTLPADSNTGDTIGPRLGDYHAFQVNVDTSGAYNEEVYVHTTSGSLTPVLLIFGPNGESVQTPRSDGSFLLHIDQSGTYTLVVGAHDGNSTGSYTLGLNRVKDIASLPSNPTSILSQVSADESSANPVPNRLPNHVSENSIISTVDSSALDTAILHSGVPLLATPDIASADTTPTDTSSDQNSTDPKMTDHSQTTDVSSNTDSTMMDQNVAATTDSAATMASADAGAATQTPNSSATSSPSTTSVPVGTSVTVATGTKFKGLVKINPAHHVHGTVRFHFGQGSKGRV